MTMKFFFAFLVVTTLFYACKKQDNDMPIKQLETVPTILFDYENSIVYNTMDLIKLNYTNGKLTKVVGGYLNIPGGTIFIDKIYWDISYAGGLIKMEKKSNDLSVRFFEKEECTYQNKKLMKRRLYVDDKLERELIYSYNDKGNIKSETTFWNDIKLLEKEYYFNAEKNLDSIRIVNFYEGQASKSYTVEIYEDYDKQINKYRGFSILKEMLVRSLPVNNYRTKRVYHIGSDGNRILKTRLNWSGDIFR